MENASKALIMVSGVLIGVIILSMAVYLFNVLGRYVADTQRKIDEDEISQFNDKFLKYNGLTNLTIQDVITVKNYALENNNKYGNYNVSTMRAKNNNDYIDVYLGERKSPSYIVLKLILAKDDEELLKTEIQGKNDKKITCEVKVNSLTGRVNKIYFYKTGN